MKLLIVNDKIGTLFGGMMKNILRILVAVFLFFCNFLSGCDNLEVENDKKQSGINLETVRIQLKFGETVARTTWNPSVYSNDDVKAVTILADNKGDGDYSRVFEYSDEDSVKLDINNISVTIFENSNVAAVVKAGLCDYIFKAETVYSAGESLTLNLVAEKNTGSVIFDFDDSENEGECKKFLKSGVSFDFDESDLVKDKTVEKDVGVYSAGIFCYDANNNLTAQKYEIVYVEKGFVTKVNPFAAEGQEMVLYTVIFMDEDNVLAVKKVAAGEKCPLPETVPAKTGFILDGWLLEDNVYDFDSPVEKSFVLKAKWTVDLDYLFKSELNANMMAYLDYLMQPVKENYPWYLTWSSFGEGYKGKWNYIEGVLLKSIVELYKSDTVNNKNYMDFVRDYVNYYIEEDGTFYKRSSSGTSKTTSGAFTEGELDSICESFILYDLLEYTKDSRYVTAIEKTKNSLEKIKRCLNENGGTGVNFNHKDARTNQIWLDGFYMYGPFYTKYAGYSNNSSIYETVYEQYKFCHDHTWDSNKKLHYHGIDTTVFKDGSTPKSWACTDSEAQGRPLGTSESFWLRSNGWFIVSLCDVIELFPEGTQKEALKLMLKESLEGVLQYKDSATNMFYEVVDGIDSNGPKSFEVSAGAKNLCSGRKNNWLLNKEYTENNGTYFIKNYLETSGSAMMAYSFMKAARLGYVDTSYGEIGKSIFEGIYKNEFSANGNNYSLNHIVIQSGLDDTAGSAPGYYVAEPVGSNEPKGIGPFLMAYLEYAKF